MTNGFFVENHKDWVLISIDERIDAFNWKGVIGQVDEIVGAGKKRIAIDLGQAKFLSLPSIKYFSSMAQDLEKKGGRVALLAPSEKLMRQFHIFATLKCFGLYRSYDDWEQSI